MVMFCDIAFMRHQRAYAERVRREKRYKLKLAYTDQHCTISRITLTWVGRVPLEVRNISFFASSGGKVST